MLNSTKATRLMTTTALVVLAALGMAACSETTEPEEEPDIASIVVTSGTSVVTVPATGTQTPGALQLKVNTANAISFRFLNSAGADEPVLVAEREHLELRLTVGTATQTFTAGTGATWNATVTPTATGTAAYTFVLFSTEHGHAELTKTLSVNVVP